MSVRYVSGLAGNLGETRVKGQQPVANQIAGAPNLLAWWRFQEGSGTTLNDSSGNSRGGTWNAAPTYEAVEYPPGSSGVLLNGSTQYATLTSSTFLNSLTGFSVAAWFRTTQTAGQQICARGLGGVATNLMFQFQTDGSGHIACPMASGATQIVPTGGTTINDGNWHLAVATYSTSAGGRVYVDGYQDCEPLSLSGGTLNSPAENMMIGARISSSPANKWVGDIAEVAVANTAWTAKQIRDFYLTGKNDAAPF